MSPRTPFSSFTNYSHNNATIKVEDALNAISKGFTQEMGASPDPSCVNASSNITKNFCLQCHQLHGHTSADSHPRLALLKTHASAPSPSSMMPCSTLQPSWPLQIAWPSLTCTACCILLHLFLSVLCPGKYTLAITLTPPHSPHSYGCPTVHWAAMPKPHFDITVAEFNAST